MGEFKGTKGTWVNGDTFLKDHNGVWKSIYLKEDFEKDPLNFEMIANIGTLDKFTEKDSENLNLMTEAGNVRQQINCSLTELLWNHKEIESMCQTQLIYLHNEIKRFKSGSNEHARLIGQKQAFESILTKINKT